MNAHEGVEGAAADRLTLAWVGDIARIRAFLDAHRCEYDLTETGRGAAWKVTIHQITPKIGGNEVTARPGDTLRFEEALLRVDKRVPKPKAAPAEPPASFEDVLAEIEAGA